MRVAAIQMSPGTDKKANIAQAQALIGRAIQTDRPTLLMLPEMWTCLGGDHATKLAAAEKIPAPGEPSMEGSAYRFLQQTARDLGLWVHGGSIAEQVGDRLFNTSIVFSPDGSEAARYRKIHLFDIVTPDGAGYRESASFGAGEQVVTLPIGDVKAGLAICYDLRFPELFLQLRRAGASVILLPAAFTLQTGMAHWHVLLRARAIETQCWIVAAATTGAHSGADGTIRQTYGHSLICDPWGTVVAQAGGEPGWVSAEINPALTERVRKDMPVLEHRRLI